MDINHNKGGLINEKKKIEKKRLTQKKKIHPTRSG